MRFDPVFARIARFVVAIPSLVLAMAAFATGPVHRCIDEGRVTYSDRACGEHSVVIAVDALAPVPLGVREETLSYATASPVSLGMLPGAVFDALGRPYETVARLEGRRLVEYWFYRGGEGTTRIAFHEGRVTRIHNP